MTQKILIVDDSKLARMAAAKALNSLHPAWTRLEAANAEEALAVAKISAIDVAWKPLRRNARRAASAISSRRATRYSSVTLGTRHYKNERSFLTSSRAQSMLLKNEHSV